MHGGWAQVLDLPMKMKNHMEIRWSYPSKAGIVICGEQLDPSVCLLFPRSLMTLKPVLLSIRTTILPLYL